MMLPHAKALVGRISERLIPGGREGSVPSDAGNDNSHTEKLSAMISAFNSICEAIDQQIAKGREILRSSQEVPSRGYIDVKGDRANCLSGLGKRQLSKLEELHDAFNRLDANVQTNSKLYGPTRTLQMLALNDIERSRLITLFNARQAKFDAWANASGYAENCSQLEKLEKMLRRWQRKSYLTHAGPSGRCR